MLSFQIWNEVPLSAKQSFSSPSHRQIQRRQDKRMDGPSLLLIQSHTTAGTIDTIFQKKLIWWHLLSFKTLLPPPVWRIKNSLSLVSFWGYSDPPLLTDRYHPTFSWVSGALAKTSPVTGGAPYTGTPTWVNPSLFPAQFSFLHHWIQEQLCLIAYHNICFLPYHPITNTYSVYATGKTLF